MERQTSCICAIVKIEKSTLGGRSLTHGPRSSPYTHVRTHEFIPVDIRERKMWIGLFSFAVQLLPFAHIHLYSPER